MHFLTDEQMQFKNELRRFVDAEMRPAAAELDRSAAYPAALFARLGQLGYLDAAFLSDSSETRYNALEGTIIIEEVSRGLASLGLIISPQFQCCDGFGRCDGNHENLHADTPEERLGRAGCGTIFPVFRAGGGERLR